jgi:sec-independent protein translocase protein TatC
MSADPEPTTTSESPSSAPLPEAPATNGSAKPSFPPPGTASAPVSAPPPKASAPGGATSNTPPPPPPEGAAGEEGHAMTLWEHLEELRSRLIRAIISFLVGGIVAWFFKDELLKWLLVPFAEAWPKELNLGDPAIHFESPAALFLAYIRIAAMSGLVFAMPFILYQIWAFVAPGLYSREKKFAAPFVLSSCALFAGGGWFGWKFAFPAAFKFLLELAPPAAGHGIKVEPTVMIGSYLEFVTHMLLAFGFMSQLPILILFLSIAGIVNHRHLIKFFRYFIVLAFVISAVITPPDPLSQLLLAIPLIGLYGVSILVAYFFGKKDLAV